MTRALEEIERDIQALIDEQRLVLPRSLIAELDGPADADVEEDWLTQAEGRDRAMGSDAVQSIPAEDVFAEARAILAGGMHGG